MSRIVVVDDHPVFRKGLIALLRGAMWLGAGVARPPLSPATTEALPGLTPREAMIADLLSRGLTNPMIAERLCLSTKTVANYVSAVMLKLGAADRDEAARIVRGWPGDTWATDRPVDPGPVRGRDLKGEKAAHAAVRSSVRSG